MKSPRRSSRAHRPAVLPLETRALLDASAPAAMGAMGDSFSNAGRYGGVNPSWIEQLVNARGLDFGAPPAGGGTSYAYDMPAWTSGNFEAYHAANVQAPALVSAIQAGAPIRAGVLEVGAHDLGPIAPTVTYTDASGNTVVANSYDDDAGRPITNTYTSIFNSQLTGANLQGYIGRMLGDIMKAAQAVQQAGAKMVVANVPDFGDTPFLQPTAASDPAKHALVTAAIDSANVQLQALTDAAGMPLVDLKGLMDLTVAPQVLGGVTVNPGVGTSSGNPPAMYLDSQHPGGIPSGLFANLVIEALDGSFGYNIDPLTDQEILTACGVTPAAAGPTYFDVRPFVHQVDQVAPASALVGLSGPSGSNGWYTGAVTVTLSASDNRFGSGVASVLYSTDGGVTWRTAAATGAVADPGAPYGADGAPEYALTLEADGVYHVLVRAIDRAGNHETPIALPEIKIDRPSPASAGDVDLTFGTGGLVTTNIPGPMFARPMQVLVQPDGKILEAGLTLGMLGPASAVVRVNPDGTPDPTFGTDGHVAPLPAQSVLALQADGKILVVAKDVERLNPDGSPDTTFGASGHAALGALVNFATPVITVQPADGKILVAATLARPTPTHEDVAMVRLNPDGSLDSTFGTAGFVVTDLGTNSEDLVDAVAVQADGKILLLCTTDAAPNVGAGTGLHLALVRYDADGGVDASYGPSGTGRVIDGDIIPLPVHGLVALAGGGSLVMDVGGSLTRFDASGSLETGFGRGGTVVPPSAPLTGFIGRAVVVQPADGKIVIGGNADNPADSSRRYYALLRYNPDGSPDLGFGDGGAAVGVRLDTAFGFSDVAVQGDGKLVYAWPTEVFERPTGYRLDGFALGRANADGSVDTAFGSGGTSRLPLHGLTIGHPHAVAIQGDGKIVVAGDVTDSYQAALIGDPSAHFAVARYDADGTLDPTFGTGGLVTTDFFSNINGVVARATGVAVQADGKVLVGGYTNSPFGGQAIALVRYNPDGSLDADFGAGGRVIDQQTPMWLVKGLALQDDGKIVVTGGTLDGSLVLARFNADGSLDCGFGAGGSVTTAASTYGPFIATDQPTGVVIQPDGKIVALGLTTADDPDSAAGFDQSFALVRVDADGLPDASFGSDGVVTTSFGPGRIDQPMGLVLQPDGKIVAAGLTEVGWGPGDFALARYNPDGSLDAGFGSGGRVVTDFGADEWATWLALQSDGRIVAGGLTSNDLDPDAASYAEDFALARYNPDGSLDAAFGAGGLATTSFGPDLPWSELTGLALQADGKVVAVGYASGTFVGMFSEVLTDFGLARYDGGALRVSGQSQVSGQLQALERTVAQPGQAASIAFDVADNDQLTELIAAANRYDAAGNPAGLAAAPAGTMTITVNLAGGTYGGQTIDLWPGETLVIRGASGTTTFVGHSPALTVRAGAVVALGVTFTNATDAPTIQVEGGTLTLRDSTVQESTGYAQVAIRVTGGAVDLGTAADPGQNVINVNGAGTPIRDTGPGPVSAVGAAFTVDDAPLGASSLSGVVFEDFNDDGQVDFGERGIAGVAIRLDGTDFLGNPVHLGQVTDGDGAYVFAGLNPGSYTITEAQPAGYTQGINTAGTGGGAVSGDQFAVDLAADLAALNDNFGERPAATGAVAKGQTAGIGFWNNRNGQALIRALNGGAGHRLGDWLAATFPHMFGAYSGGSDLSGRSNADVASFFQSRFVAKDEKLDAQVLATALAVYVTNATLDDTGVGAQYGFVVAGDGVGTATYSVGTGGSAFGVADGTVMTVLDILRAADAQAVVGVLYNGDRTRRARANAVFGGINQAGSL